MIDFHTEELVTFADACKILPKRAGKKPHVSTIYRWSRNGFRGIRLETIKVGGTTYTSVEALQRFFDALTERDYPQAPPTLTTSRRRQRELASVEARLRKEGFL